MDYAARSLFPHAISLAIVGTGQKTTQHRIGVAKGRVFGKTAVFMECDGIWALSFAPTYERILLETGMEEKACLCLHFTLQSWDNQHDGHTTVLTFEKASSTLT